MRWSQDNLKSMGGVCLSGLIVCACGSNSNEAREQPKIPSGVEIPTEQGDVHGEVVGKTRAFRGIPYAAPPLGDLRFRPPQPAESRTSVLDATKVAASCPQFGTVGISDNPNEDCLTINVWSPEPAPSAALPVMVWIHGGGFLFGSGSDPAYDGRLLSESTGAVVVTLNYRLGPLGYLALPALADEDPINHASGNYGLQDQRAALAWVKANIASFGGDPSAVTLFGESAGGISTCLHLAAPASSDLFRSAIIQSGPCSLGVTTKASAEALGSEFASALGCTDSNSLPACLRTKSIDDMKALGMFDMAAQFAGQVSWGPVIDEPSEFPDHPLSLLASGPSRPVLLGTTKDEGTLFVLMAFFSGLTDAKYQATLEWVASFTTASASNIAAEYPVANYASQKAALAEVLGDALFVCPTRRDARAIAENAPTFLYQFRYEAQSELLGDGLGAFHASDTPFVLGNSNIGVTVEPDGQSLAEAMRAYWANVAFAGDPNRATLPEWPIYDADLERHIVLDKSIATESHLKKSKCDFWDSITFRK